ncbi:PstS family phosphate ABC transporter substrate-binding protein [Halovenus sp. HT40]|uniref:PstS family phosphate ABC transporter substrate-binding protein n=1 Tax=Halovenus sp. HT40 TaxID=3126691 RepID=UPI00300EC217
MFDPSIGLSRRSFVTTAGSVTALSLAGCVEDDNADSENSTPENDGNETDTDGGNDDEDDSESDEQKDSGEIQIAGSSTVFPLMSAISEKYRQENSGVQPSVNRTGTGGGFSNFFCVGNVDFNNASRAIQPEEEDLCSENDIEYIELTLATDALTIVVGEDSFVDCLTVDELAQIWKADGASTWDEVRDEFPNEEIQRYGAAETSGTYDYLIENIQDEEEGHTDEYTATERDNKIAQAVKSNEYAIGYFGFAYYYQNPDGLKAVGIDNGDGCVKPSLESAQRGEYQPLSRSLYTYLSLDSLAEDYIAEFARYVIEQTTNEELVAGTIGYVPLSDSQQEEQMQKLEAAIEESD